MENIKEQIEEVIKKNLPEKKEAGLYTTSKATGGDIINYNREDNDDKRDGFNQAISQINTSLIADEVLKVVGEKIEELRKTKTFPQQLIHLDHSVEHFERLSGGDIHYNKALDDLLSNLSTNKENKNNE